MSGWLTTEDAAAYLGYRGPHAAKSFLEWCRRHGVQPDGRRGPRGLLFRPQSLDRVVTTMARPGRARRLA